MPRDARSFSPIPLRLVLGFGFVYHGYPKLFTLEGHAGFSAMLQGLGIPSAGLAAWCVAAIEFFGGIALLAGAFTALSSILLIIDMLVALFTVHGVQGFNFINVAGQSPEGPIYGLPGYEVNLLYIAGLLSLLLSGAGPGSVDGMLEAGRRTRFGADLSEEEQTVITPVPPHTVARVNYGEESGDV